MTVHGSCLCGAATYEAAIPLTESGTPKPSHICHCRMCRKITSAYTSANLDIPAANFRLTSGALKQIRTTHKDDGFEFSVFFCPECGSSIYAQPHIEGFETTVIVQIGTLDDEAPLKEKPAYELNTKHRMPWITKVEEARQNDGY